MCRGRHSCRWFLPQNGWVSRGHQLSTALRCVWQALEEIFSCRLLDTVSARRSPVERVYVTTSASVATLANVEPCDCVLNSPLRYGKKVGCIVLLQSLGFCTTSNFTGSGKKAAASPNTVTPEPRVGSRLLPLTPSYRRNTRITRNN